MQLWTLDCYRVHNQETKKVYDELLREMESLGLNS